MKNEETNLNTESNDIAGNRIDGPAGNTATQHTGPGMGVGMPGGPPTAAPAAPATAPDIETPTAPASSESLAASETSVSEGAVEPDPQPQENKEADPADPNAAPVYGGNFGNSTQGSYHDEDRRENQDSDPNRGEFGTQGHAGTTHGGFGNQNRQADYEPNNTAEDRYYGGPGAAGPQDNAYRAYDGRDERPDSRTEYGFEPGTTVDLSPTSKTADSNDNGSPKGPDSAYARDYGHTSLPGNALPGTAPAPAAPDRRNQTEDYLPTPGSEAPTAGTANPEADGQRPASSQGYGDRGRDQPNEAPNFQTSGARDGYVQSQANNGDAGQGVGSRGGSYNDAYDDSKPGSTAGSPAKGDERREDRSQNYGAAAREENRTGGEDQNDDHGAPQRNAGRDE